MNVAQMLRIAHSVNDKVYTVNHRTDIQSVAQSMDKRKVGAFPVLREGKLVGIISERDITTRVVARGLNPQKTLTFFVMTSNPITVTPNDDLETCLDLMEAGHFRHLPVLDEGKLVGMISIRDILVALLREKGELINHFQNYLFSNR